MAAGWSGALSLPRLLSLRDDGTLGIEPVPELEALRGEHRRFENVALGGDQSLLLPGVQSDAFELQVRFAPTGASRFGALVRCSPDESERTEIAYDRDTRRLLDAPLTLADGEELTLRIFVDRSVIEVFANGRACQTLRVYPQRSDSLGVGLFAQGGGSNGVQATVDVWEMRPVAAQGL